jgi:hypothetical protein
VKILRSPTGPLDALTPETVAAALREALGPARIPSQKS